MSRSPQHNAWSPSTYLHDVLQPSAAKLSIRTLQHFFRAKPTSYFQATPSGRKHKLHDIGTITITMASSTIEENIRPLTPGNQAFPFLELPPEICVMVYKHAFSYLGILRSAAEVVSANNKYLDRVRADPWILTFASWYRFLRPGMTHADRAHTEQDFAIQLSNKDAVPILRTCQLIFQEAAPILYQTAAFHHSLCLKQPDMPNPNQFLLIRHMSIDFSDASPRVLMFEELQRCNVDSKIAASVDSIAKMCTSLKSLTLHVIAIDGISKMRQSGRAHESCKALAKLAPRLERLSIIAPSTAKSMEDLCELIAPLQGWQIGRSRRWPLRWPLLTLPVAHFETMRAVTDNATLGDYRTRKDVVCLQVATLQPERGFRA